MLSFDELKQIVRERTWDNLQGEQEDLFLDCKSQPYALSDADEEIARLAKAEFAKDVSSFANKEGGFILIGFRTRRVANQSTELIIGPREIPRNRFDGTQHINVIGEWVYPPIDGLEIRFEPGSSAESGIGVIEIPPQGDDKKPFLIKRQVVSGKLSEIMVGYVERVIDNSIPTRVEELHRYLRDGRLYHTLMAERLESIEAELKGPSEAATEERPSNLDERIREIEERLSLTGTKILVISASIENAQANVRGFLERGDGSIQHLLRRLPKVRRFGFTPGYGLNFQLDRGKSWISLEGDRAVAFYQDGTLLSILPTDDEFLCKGAEGERGSSQKINTVVLTESIYVFLDWYLTLHNQVEPNGWTIQVCVDLRVGDENRPYLVPYEVNTLFWENPPSHEKYPCPEAQEKWCVEIERDYDPSRVAVELLKVIYAWFGVVPDAIPYTNRHLSGNSERFVDPTSF